MSTRVAVLVCVLLVSGVGSASPDSGDADLSSVDGEGAPVASVAEVYPNPAAADDRGEFVVLEVPPETPLGRYELDDGEDRVSLPNASTEGPVVLSTAPNLTRRYLDRPVRPLSPDLRLANSGERLSLLRNGTAVDRLEYRDAPEGEVLVVDGQRRWRPLGATDRPVVTGGPGTVRAFVLPDAPSVSLEHLRRADDRILLAGYTLSSARVADALADAARRNVSVSVLVDGDPVGGMSRRQARVLDRLARAGVRVRLLGGSPARYDFHHAKYAVVDDRALVATENWKPAGLGGRSSRGWGVLTNQSSIVGGLVDTFVADASGQDTLTWRNAREDREFVASSPANGSYPSQFVPKSVRVERTRLLVAPDNAQRELVDLIEDADESVDVQQVSVGSPDQALLRATVDAARRGVRVRILLSGAWYVREENERLVEGLNRRASQEKLPLEAKIARPRNRFEKIHAKGVVVDGDRVVVGSLNWNNNSASENREVLLVLSGNEVGRYYERVFESDWRGGRWRLSVGFLVAIALVAVLAVRRSLGIRFEE